MSISTSVLSTAALVALLAVSGCRANAAPGKDESSDLMLSRFQPITGTDVMTASLGDPSGGAKSSRASSYLEYDGGGSTRNVLFYDANEAAGRWLFPANSALVLDRFDLRSAADSTVEAIVYAVVFRDTDGDDELSASDERSYVAVHADGTGRKTIARGVEQDLGHFRTSDRAYTFTHVVDGHPAAVVLTLDSLGTQAVTMPKVPGVNS